MCLSILNILIKMYNIQFAKNLPSDILVDKSGLSLDLGPYGID